MTQSLLQIDVIQDGQTIPNGYIDKYNLEKRDIFYPSNGEARSNFVGIVQRDESILISIPKHFMHVSDFKTQSTPEKKKYTRLIMDSINASVLGYQNSSYDSKLDTSSNFALAAYFNIYEYFAQYGLYQEDYQEIRPNSGNKVSWKDTLRKSNKFFSNGNIIFSPLYYKKRRSNQTLITECMISILNYTQSLLGDFITLPDTSKIANKGFNKNIFNNESVILKLQEILTTTFKDINRQLIRNIIIFLKKVNDNKLEVVDIKYYGFAHTWETAVEKYLNDHFLGISKDNEVIFSNTNTQKKFIKDKISYNDANKFSYWRLEPDHVLIDDKNKFIYLFDSKYYTTLKDLNHKQFVYHILYSNGWPTYQIYDSLILPTEEKGFTEEYLKLNKKYSLRGRTAVNIYLTYLNMIEVLENFIK